jgi:RecB family exonuclease
VGLTLVTGPANSAKAGCVLDAYRAALPREPLLVVPTWPDVVGYTRELASEGTVVGGAVVRFKGLAREIGARTDVPARPLRGLQRERLVTAAVRSAPLRELAGPAASPGFARAAARLIAELERSLVEPAALRRALREVAGGDRARRRYGDEVAGLYAEYRRLLERSGRTDAELFAWRALDALRARPDRWGGSPVFLYGFDDLTRLELDAIETLSRVAGAPVTVSLTYEAGRAALAGRARAFEELKPLADRVVTLPAAADHYEPASRELLHRLERGLFDDEPLDEPPPEEQPLQPTLFDEPAPLPGPAPVSLLEAGGERAEIELVASEVLRIAAAGVALDEVVVVFRSPARYASLVEQVFGAYGIPCAVAGRVALSHTPIGAAVLALLRAALPGGSACDLLTYLRAPGLVRVPALVDALEARLRGEATDDVDAALAEWERIAGWPLDEVARMRQAAARGTRSLLPELRRRGERLLAAPHGRTAPLLDRGPESADAAAFATLTAALDELEELAAIAPSALPSPAELPAVLGEVEARTGARPRPGAVEVAGPLDVRARRYRVVIAAGLQEGEFPVRGRPEPFLSDELRAQLHAHGVPLQPREDLLAAERYLFYAVASRPTERLVLSWRVSDEEGSPVLPSAFLADVHAVLGDSLNEPRRRPLADVTWPAGQAPTPAEEARALAAARPPARPSPIESLHAETILAGLRERVLSAGALEAYAGCPVKWLVERHLRARELGPEPVAMVSGSLRHELLERTLAGLRDRTGSARLHPGSLPTALEILREQMRERREHYLLSSHGPTARAQARGIERDLERYLEFEARAQPPFEPRELELSFGFDEDGEASELEPLELGDGAVRLRGRIDRVDVEPGGDRAVIRDYKSSRALGVARWEIDHQLQVALYMLAARRLLGLRPVAGVYQGLRRDLKPRGIVAEGEQDALGAGAVVDTDVRPPDELEAVLAQAEATACELAERMRAGDLEPTPDSCGARGVCAYPGICRSVG